MSANLEPHYDFVVLRARPGIDRASLEIDMVTKLGAKTDKAALLLDHLAKKGPVAIEKGINAARVEELKQKWESIGFVISAEVALGLVIDAPVENTSVPMLTCPSCGHKQEKRGEADQCAKCGVFPHKFAEQQRKQALIAKERERLEQIHGFAKRKEEQQAKEAAEQAEIDEIRRKLEEEMGLNKKKSGWDAWLMGGAALSGPLKAVVAVGVLIAVLAGGYFIRDFITPAGPSPEMLAKQQEMQKQQTGTQIQQAVGQMIVGSKKMAQASGAAEQFSKEIFNGKGADLDLDEQILAAETGNAAVKDALSGGDRAEGLAQAARNFSEVGGNAEDTERALGASMQSAKEIKEDGKRTAAVSAVAGAQFDVHTLDARKKLADGNWRGADKSFSKAMSAATDISSKSDVVAARTSVAKARAETGDYGGAALLYLDALKAAEEVPDARERALALADVARSIAETSNELTGAAERAFEKALATANGIRVERDRAAAANGVLFRRVQAAGNIGAFLISIKEGAKALKETLDHAGKDADTITDPVMRARALAIIAQVIAESGDAAGTTARLAAITSLIAELPTGQSDAVLLVAARAKAETLAAAAKFKAGQGDRPGAKQGFLDALKAANAISTKSTDPQTISEFAKERSDALSTVARFMQAAGDKKAAEKIFKLATQSTTAK